MNPKLILAGGSGFLGGELAEHFSARGWEVVVLTRSPKSRTNSAREVAWDAATIGDWSRELEGATAVVNLTGRSVDCRYTAKNRREIMDSRVNSTRVVGQAIALCKTPPRVWLNSSTARCINIPSANRTMSRVARWILPRMRRTRFRWKSHKRGSGHWWKPKLIKPERSRSALRWFLASDATACFRCCGV